MELLKGLSVAGAADRTRLRLYEGIAQVGSAFVPRLPARPLTDGEYRNLCHVPMDLGTRNFVAVVPAPVELRKILPDATVAQTERPWRVEEVVAQATRFASGFVEDDFDHELKSLGIIVRQKGLLTSTFDGENGCFIGLHIDSYYMEALGNRERSPNRLCINLTSEPRRLLFINLSLIQCRDLLVASGCQDPLLAEPRTRGLPGLFMKHVPDYPVLELRIDSDEAYVAPTENMIHDGSTLRRQQPDVFLTFLGDFSLRRVLERTTRPVGASVGWSFSKVRKA